MPDHPTARRSRRAWRTVVVVTLALTMVACSGKKDDEGSGANGGTTPGTGVVDETVVASSDPVAGGDVIYGIGAESDGWNPTRNSWGPEGIQIALTVYDPLAAYDVEGVAQPYLAESIEPNADFTEWTITLREGITFHNGEPLTAEAVKTTLDGHVGSPLTGPAVRPIESIEVVSDLATVLTMNMPWVAFPATLTAQLGVVPYPSIVTENINDEPIGTGPFTFDEWIPDSRFVATKNPEYWRDGLPYLDSIEYRPLPDADARQAAFDAGDVDMITAGSPDDILTYRAAAEEGDDVQYFADQGENEEGFIMLNTAAPPFDDVRVRRALALATNQESYNEIIDKGVLRIPTGPFVPDNPFYVEVDYPTYDLAAAEEILAEVEAETGEPVSFTLGNTADDFGREQSAFLQEMWQAAGFEVEVTFTEQSAYILDALGGAYEAVAWRQFGQPDPDGDYHWWHSQNAAPIGESGLNFSRISDPDLDAALDEGRSNPDPEARAEAYRIVQERFAELVPFVWLAHVEWGIVARPWVQGVPSGPLPDGQDSKPFVTGTHRIGQMWIDPALQ